MLEQQWLSCTSCATHIVIFLILNGFGLLSHGLGAHIGVAHDREVLSSQLDHGPVTRVCQCSCTNTQIG